MAIKIREADRTAILGDKTSNNLLTKNDKEPGAGPGEEGDEEV